MLRKKFIYLSKFAALAALTINTTQALPIDWHGVFGVDTTLIDNYRKIKNTTDNKPIASNIGSQEIGLGSGNEKASFQSYIFRLNPHIIVNDTASFKAELTSGYGRGGRLGDDSTTDNTNDNFGNALYIQNKSSSSKSIVINQAYMELYSDTATYIIGRHSSDWGLGAVYNSGKDTWDRHAFSRDGVTAKIKIGNFLIEPYWAKIDSTGSLSRNTKSSEIGAGLLYDNVDRDIAFGLLYSKKNNKQDNPTTDTNTTGASSAYALGETDVKVTDIYFKKIFGNFKLEVEVPIISGELGKVYNTDSTKVNSKSFIFETEYKVSDSWTIAFDFGSISGHSGSRTSYEAMFLNPNYQVANLLFRYNLQAIGNTNHNIYDSYMTNATYAKIAGEYKSDKWSWVAAMIWAKANETAKLGESSYNHTNNKVFTANDTQESDLGMEIDLNFDYHWNSAVKVGGSLGYLFAGDYFSFTNDPSNKNTADNSFALQLNSSIEF